MSEQRIVLLYLLCATVGLTALAGWVLANTYGYPAVSARYLAKKMDREQRLFAQQREDAVLLDSVRVALVAYHSDITAVFIESDIEEQIRDIRHLYAASDSLPLYRSFDQAANFCQFMYKAKQILSSKKFNAGLFAKRLDDCQVGYQPAPAGTPAGPAMAAVAAVPAIAAVAAMAARSSILTRPTIPTKLTRPAMPAMPAMPAVRALAPRP